MDKIKLEIIIDASVEKVWEVWTSPEHIVKWHVASDDWHTPHATNDATSGGRFLTRMEAIDGSFGFDFSGTYTNVTENEIVSYTLDDERKVMVTFESIENQTEVNQEFDPEKENPVDMQRQGWNQILIRFKRYVESL